MLARTMKIIRNYRDVKVVTTDPKRNNLVSDPKYHKTKGVSEKLLPTEIKNKSRTKYACTFRYADFRSKQDSHVRLLKWLCNTDSTWIQAAS